MARQWKLRRHLQVLNAYQDQNNSLYSVINKVDVTSGQDEQGRRYVIDQFSVDKLERELKGGLGSEVESDMSDNNSDKDEDE